MVVCKFFLQGNCRFGDNCKFEHQISDFNAVSASILRQNQPQQQPQQVQQNFDVNVAIRAVANDMILAEKGGQWLLSCYAPFKAKPAFPGFEDMSFEEVRYGFHSAQRSGTLEQYKEQLQAMLQAAAMRIRALQNPSPEIMNIIKNLFNSPGINENTAKNNFSFADAGTSILAQNTSAPSIFAQQSANVFAQNQRQSSANVFAQNQSQQPSANVFAQNQSQQASANVFAQNQPQQPSANIFAQNQSQQSGANVFAQKQSQPNVFAQNQPQQQSANIFAQATHALFGNKTQQNVSNVFINAAQQQQQSNVFASPQQQQSNVFAVSQQQQQQQQQQQRSSVFAPQQQQPQPAFTTTQWGANTFQGQQGGVQSGAAFALPQQNTNIFGGGVQTQIAASFRGQDHGDDSAYSMREDLAESELKAFEADSFDFGQIPEKPPTKQLCF